MQDTGCKMHAAPCSFNHEAQEEGQILNPKSQTISKPKYQMFQTPANNYSFLLWNFNHLELFRI
jgi:hypothetical protein